MPGFFDADERSFSPDACELWQTARIPQAPMGAGPRFLRWLHTDSEENYYERGNRYFTVESVGYELNSFGYRGPEFAVQPGEAGVLFLGDSNTLGLGMPWESVWSSVVTRRLQDRWSIPVRPLNLAWSATGSDYTAMMIHQAIDVLRPAAVFVLWSFVGRMTWYPDPRHQVHFIPEWTSDVHASSHAAYLRLASQSHGFFNFVRNFHFVQERLGRLGIPFYWGHLEQFSPRLLSTYVPLDRFAGTWQPLDLARDARHAGVQTHELFAERVMAAVARDPVRQPTQNASMSALQANHFRLSSRIARLNSWLPRTVRHRLAEARIKRQVRALRRKDPFIY